MPPLSTFSGDFSEISLPPSQSDHSDNPKSFLLLFNIVSSEYVPQWSQLNKCRFFDYHLPLPQKGKHNTIKEFVFLLLFPTTKLHAWKMVGENIYIYIFTDHRPQASKCCVSQNFKSGLHWEQCLLAYWLALT